jgi:hypothetical protein
LRESLHARFKKKYTIDGRLDDALFAAFFFFFVVAVFGGCVSLVFFFGAVVQFTITFLKVRSQRDKKKSDKQNKHANNNLG